MASLRASNTHSSGARRWLGPLIALAALLLYTALRQHTFYKGDAGPFVASLALGEMQHSWHTLYLPFVHGCALLARPLHLAPFWAATWASALGTALGIGFCCLATVRLGVPPARAALTGVLCALAPAVVFFATVVEVHGPFFAFAGLCWYCAARAVAAPSLASTLVLGASTSLASFAHATGHLLPLLIAPWAIVELRGSVGARRLACGCAVLALAHAVTTLAISAALPLVGLRPPVGAQTYFLTIGIARNLRLSGLLSTLFYEWAVPFAPLSFLVLAAAARDRMRLLALATGILGYALVTLVLLGADRERGAYLLPLVFPAALLTCRALPPSWLWIMAIASAGFSVVQVRAHDIEPPGTEYLEDLARATRGQNPLLLLGAQDELDPVLRERPELLYLQIYTMLDLGESNSGVGAEWMAATLDRESGRGRTLYVGQQTLDQMRAITSVRPDFRISKCLEERYRLVAIHEGKFSAYRLERRQ